MGGRGGSGVGALPNCFCFLFKKGQLSKGKNLLKRGRVEWGADSLQFPHPTPGKQIPLLRVEPFSEGACSSFLLTNFRLNKLFHTIYWKSQVSVHYENKPIQIY